ncbi:VanZ family protein [Veillonella denticariosi]|uniref:VanZ family protein n=1 Tax=Veillonella denticariosi TaxID=419208 RepID=UPI002490BA05|nr:VanZ family protein [Veillonella denticariosi]
MKRFGLYIVLSLIIFFIWDNSLQNGGTSDGFSLVFAKWLLPLVHKLGFHANIWSLNRVVRKLAHVTEFAFLGGVLYIILKRYITYGTVLKTVGIGIAVAALDEFLQRFSPGRSSQLSDVLIDTLGVIIGIIVVKVILYIGQSESSSKRYK